MKKILFLALLVCLPGVTASYGAKLISNGATDQSISVVILNSDGDPNSVFDPADFDVYVQLDGAHPQSSPGHTLTAHTNAYDAHADWYGYNMGNGILRIDIADANLSDGAGSLLTYIVRSTTSDANSYYEVQLTPPVDVKMWLGTACSTPSIAGVPEVDMVLLEGVDATDSMATPSDLWTYETRTLTELDEDNTTIDLDNTQVHSLVELDEDNTTIDLDNTQIHSLVELDEDNTTIDLDSTTVNATVDNDAIADAVMEELVTDHDDTRWSLGWILKQIYGALF